MKRFSLLSVLSAAIIATLASCEPIDKNEVKNPETIEVSEITLSEKSISISVNEEKTLVAEVKPSNATDKNVTWSSDNESIASVSNGKVKGVGVGNANITARAGGKSASCTVTVSEPVLVITGEATNLTWNSATLSMTVNQSLAGSYESYDAGMVYGTSQNLSTTTDYFLEIPRSKDGKPEVRNIYEFALEYLKEGTTYYYMAVATFDDKEYCGEVKSFQTPAVEIATTQSVDLGLPSGLKWAGWNVGATKPEEFGDYFCWGETSPKDSYWQDNYKYGVFNKFGTTDLIYKYNVRSEYGAVDNRTCLTSADDAAYVNWGEQWRMPTDEEKTELLANTTHRKYTYNDVPGWLFTSKNNNVSIFFPATGMREQTGTSYIGEETIFWTSTISSNDPRQAHIACNWIAGSSMLHEAGFEMDPTAESYHLINWRYLGIPVRAVSGGETPKEEYSLTTSQAKDITFCTARIEVAITPAPASATEFGLLYTLAGSSFPLIPERANKVAADASGNVLLQGLTPYTTYKACAYAIAGGKSYMGNEISFTTTGMVSLTAQDPEDVTFESAKLKATVGDLSEIIASGAAVECGIAYDETKNGYSSMDMNSRHYALTPDGNGDMEVTLTGLPYKTNFYYRAYLKVGETWYFSNNHKEFKTLDPPLAQWVDLGLSVIWASWDIGTTSGEDKSGGLFAWGETKAKTEFGITHYKWANKDKEFTKYVTRRADGHVDNKTTLEEADDAAAVAWGSGARMPTKEQFNELFANCTRTEEFYMGNHRIKFTAPNGNYIYLDYSGRYWTSSLDVSDNERAHSVYILEKEYLRQETYVRAGAALVRAVRDK